MMNFNIQKLINYKLPFQHIKIIDAGIQYLSIKEFLYRTIHCKSRKKNVNILLIISSL